MSPLLDIKEAARILSISHWTVRAYIKNGQLKPVRLGRRVLIQTSELERFVTQNCTNSPASLGKGGLS
jgi:excisionase family DNA binding protein